MAGTRAHPRNARGVFPTPPRGRTRVTPDGCAGTPRGRWPARDPAPAAASAWSAAPGAGCRGGGHGSGHAGV